MAQVLNRKKFFEALRASRVFGIGLTKGQVTGIESILDACERNNVSDVRYIAAMLSSVAVETGRIMMPIKETVMFSHKDKLPSDAVVKQRLEHAWAVGRLPWVTTPYWRSGAFGRGQIQNTHHENYVKFAKLLGVPMDKDYSLALEPKHSAEMVVRGMLLGMFRQGHNLARYFNDKVEDPKGARRIVNGQDGKDDVAARYYWAFKGSLQAGTEDDKPVEVPKKKGWWSWLFG